LTGIGLHAIWLKFGGEPTLMLRPSAQTPVNNRLDALFAREQKTRKNPWSFPDLGTSEQGMLMV
jgi:hypothetical protein